MVNAEGKTVCLYDIQSKTEFWYIYGIYMLVVHIVLCSINSKKTSVTIDKPVMLFFRSRLCSIHLSKYESQIKQCKKRCSLYMFNILKSIIFFYSINHFFPYIIFIKTQKDVGHICVNYVLIIILFYSSFLPSYE